MSAARGTGWRPSGPLDTARDGLSPFGLSPTDSFTTGARAHRRGRCVQGDNVESLDIILLAGWWLARIVRAWVRRALERTAIEPTLMPFLCSLVYYLTLTFV